MELINREIAEYAKSFTSNESDLIKELVSVTKRNLIYTDMMSGKQIGSLLKLLVQISGAKRILEVGTFTGYSTLWMADALLSDATLTTLEMNKRYSEISKPFFKKHLNGDKIEQMMGNALNLIPKLTGSFDLIYLDADKINYPSYYKLLKPKLESGGLIVIDNVLWEGQVLSLPDDKSDAIHSLNKMIRDDDQVEQVMIPFRDGITIGRKI